MWDPEQVGFEGGAREWREREEVVGLSLSNRACVIEPAPFVFSFRVLQRILSKLCLNSRLFDPFVEARQTKLAIETGIQNFSLIINPEFRENKRNFVFFFFIELMIFVKQLWRLKKKKIRSIDKFINKIYRKKKQFPYPIVKIHCNFASYLIIFRINNTYINSWRNPILQNYEQVHQHPDIYNWNNTVE